MNNNFKILSFTIHNEVLNVLRKIFLLPFKLIYHSNKMYVTINFIMKIVKNDGVRSIYFINTLLSSMSG